MPPSKWMTSCVFAALMACGISACHQMSKDPPVLGLESSDVTLFSDIPIPLAFKEKFDTDAFVKPATYNVPRSAYMHYTGGSDFLSVVHYYIDFLPQNGWKYQDQTYGSSTAGLRYTKPNETLVIRVYAMEGNTDVILELTPGEITGPGMRRPQ